MSVQASRLLAAVAAISLALAPAIADARVGGGSSSGSRGSNTHSAPPATRTAPGTAAPMERTITPNTPARPTAPAAAPHAPAPAPAPVAAPARSGFMSGLAGGLIGAGIGAMLFGGMGGGFFGHGLGFAGVLGFILQIGLVAMIGMLIWKLVARMRTRQPEAAGAPGMYGRDMAPPQGGIPPQGGMPIGNGGAPMQNPAPTTVPVNILPGDFQAFEQLLQSTQAAWSARDINALRGMTTPEMGGYFAEQLGALTNRGVTNVVTNVRLDSGDLSEAWAENGQEYATVAMRFSMIDVTKDGIGRVIEGSLNERVTATEVWTFVRPRGGQWILSAIQQTR